MADKVFSGVSGVFINKTTNKLPFFFAFLLVCKHKKLLLEFIDLFDSGGEKKKHIK